MPLFRAILDDLGIDVALGAYAKGKIRIKPDRSPLMKFTALRVTPISVESTTTGAIKGGAIGLFLAGPLGAAIGSMMGGGAKVAFQLETVEGRTFNCVMGRSAFVVVREDLERRRQAEARQAARLQMRTFRPRWLFWLATVFTPPATAWAFFRSAWGLRSKFLMACWTVVWAFFILIISVAPHADQATVARKAGGGAAAESHAPDDLVG